MLSGDFPRFPFGIEEKKIIFLILSWPKLYIVFFSLSFLLYIFSGDFDLKKINGLKFLSKPVLILFLALLFSTIFSNNKYLSFYAFILSTTILLFLIYFAFLLQEKNIYTNSWNIIALSILFLTIRVISWRLNEGISLGTYHIKNNSWLGKLQITWVLNFFAPFFFANTFSGKNKIHKTLNGLFWLISAVAITLLYSRTGFLTLSATTILICMMNLERLKKFIPLISLFILISIPLLLNSSYMGPYLFSSLVNFHKDYGVKNRIKIWKESFQMFKDHPIYGIGFGTYDEIAYTQYSTELDQFAGVKNKFFKNGWHAHNFIMHNLAETGIIGFIAWIYICYTIFIYIKIHTSYPLDKLKISVFLSFFLSFFILSTTENLLAIRVHESFRMNLTFWFLVLFVIFNLNTERIPN